MNMKLKFCANLSFMFQETPALIDRYAKARDLSFRAVECAFPYDYTIEDIANARQASGMKQILINAYVGDVSKGHLGFAAIPGQEANFKTSIHKAILYANALKCPNIHVMAGLVDEVTEANIKTYEENIRYAVSLFELDGIVGLIEPINTYTIPKYFMNSTEQALALVKSINSPNLKIMMDLFHLQHMKGNLTSNIKELMPYVGHIQVAQVPNRNEPDTKGELNYRYLFGLLVELGYEGWIGLEYKPETTTKEGLKWVLDFDYQL